MESATTGVHGVLDLPGFEEAFSGDVIGPGDVHYGAARSVWNGMIDKRFSSARENLGRFRLGVHGSIFPPGIGRD